jgi:hypothetical protein
MGSISWEEGTLTSGPQMSGISSLDFIGYSTTWLLHLSDRWNMVSKTGWGRGNRETCKTLNRNPDAYTYNTSLLSKKRWDRELLHECHKIHWFIRRSYTNVVKLSSQQFSCQTKRKGCYTWSSEIQLHGFRGGYQRVQEEVLNFFSIRCFNTW